jgi:hypothetical protein
MRPVLLGRKNWIHVGSQQAGPKVEALAPVHGIQADIDLLNSPQRASEKSGAFFC